MSKTFTEEVLFQGPVTFLILPKEFVGTLTTTTPSVKNAHVWKAGGIVLTISNFRDGAPGQTIRVLGDGTTTIQHGTRIKTNTGANVLLTLAKVYVFTLIDNVWYQDA